MTTRPSQWIDPLGLAAKTPQVFFRGDQSNLTSIESHAVKQGGLTHSENILKAGDRDELMRLHANSSRDPASPFISVTSDRQVAEFFADQNGSVYKLEIPPGRAVQNPFGIPDESEWLVEHFIPPSWIKGVTPP
jgi:hypothetical protein